MGEYTGKVALVTGGAPMFDAVLRRFGRLDVPHNGAGV